MNYCGTTMCETIFLCNANDIDDEHFIELTKDSDEPVFYVTACCDENWAWAFYMDGMANYEMIKHTVMDVAFECEDMFELMQALDAIFAEDFNDIVVQACEPCCEHCNSRECLN